MAVKINSIPLFDSFVKLILALIVFIYLFGYLWHPSIKPYAIINLICLISLCFRFSFVISDKMPKWKIIIAFFSYLIVFSDQMFDVLVNIDKGLTLSVVIMLAVVSVFFIDLFQLTVKKGVPSD